MKKLLGIVVLGLLLSGSAYSQCVSGNCVDGYGTQVVGIGHKYIGEWKDGKRHGQGTSIHVNENGEITDKFVGSFKNDRLDGKGIYTLLIGSGAVIKYDGEYKEGFQHGKGFAIYSNGSTYEGEFVRGRKHGYGTWTWLNVGKYEGEFKNGKRDGEGTYIYEEGHKTAEGIYLGEWKDGKRHGQGKYTMKNGVVQEGIWKNNGFVKIK